MPDFARDHHWAARGATLLLLTVMAAASFLRGPASAIQTSAVPSWFINYGDGFVRRGLLGQLFGLFVDQREPEHVLAAAMWVHHTGCALLIVGLLLWLLACLNRQGSAAMCCAAFALFAGSQFLPTLADDAGFLDLYDDLLVLMAAVAAVRGWRWVAGAIGLAGPLLHEGFVFIWLTLVVLEVWRARGPGGSAWLLTPLISTALVYFFSSTQAGIMQMSRAPLPQDMKDWFVAWQLNQTLSESLRILLWKYSYNFPNFLMAAAFFVFPAAVAVLVATFTLKTRRDIFALTLATLAPASILIVSWDLSRFLVTTAFANVLSVMFMYSVRPIGSPSRAAIAACWVTGLVCFCQPHVYAFFEVATVKTDAPVDFARRPIGAAVTAWSSFYSRNIGPREVPETGGENPPGNVWREEEDAWLNVWTRRPGTNIFDAVGHKGGMTQKCTLRITRGGDRIRVVRTDCDDHYDLMYAGVIHGTEISGTYPGGVWRAWIER